MHHFLCVKKVFHLPFSDLESLLGGGVTEGGPLGGGGNCLNMWLKDLEASPRSQLPSIDLLESMEDSSLKIELTESFRIKK